jgi:hypothetical protein
MKRPPIRRARKRREPPVPALVCALIIVLDAWLIGWWTVPIAALIVGAIWRGRGDAAVQAMWGAVGAWAILLLVDSLHGRSWALARAAGGAVFLPWGLLFPATLLFAAGLAWSGAVLAQALCVRLVRDEPA